MVLVDDKELLKKLDKIIVHKEDSLWDLVIISEFSPHELITFMNDTPILSDEKEYRNQLNVFLRDYGQIILSFLDVACKKYSYLDKKLQFKSYWNSPVCFPEEFDVCRLVNSRLPQ